MVPAPAAQYSEIDKVQKRPEHGSLSGFI
uniref:Uncharacterized protein n=1 Tax=Anguilla anguilla TaxID=7936 RepID=A0A0E9U2A1_ANGAN